MTCALLHDLCHAFSSPFSPLFSVSLDSPPLVPVSCALRASPVFRYSVLIEMAEIWYARSTDSRYRVPLEHTVPQRLRTTSHRSKPHRIRTQPHVHRVHPIMAEQVLEMYSTRIQATRLWTDHLTTSPHAHTHAQRARTRATSSGGALFVLSSRSSFSGAASQSFSGALFCGP